MHATPDMLHAGAWRHQCGRDAAVHAAADPLRPARVLLGAHIVVLMQSLPCHLQSWMVLHGQRRGFLLRVGANNRGIVKVLVTGMAVGSTLLGA